MQPQKSCLLDDDDHDDADGDSDRTSSGNIRRDANKRNTRIGRRMLGKNWNIRPEMKRGTSVALSQELELELEEPEEPPMVHLNHPPQVSLRGPHPPSLPAQKEGANSVRHSRSC